MATDPRDPLGPDASKVLEIVAQLKRQHQLSRLYGSAHELAGQVARDLLGKLTQYLDAEAYLPLTIAQGGLYFGEKCILEDEGREESLTRALFADGVEGIELTRGLDAAELDSLLEMWFGAVGHTLPPEHTFSTLAWERIFEHVIFSFRPGLTEGGKEENRATLQRREELEAAILGRTDLPVPRRRATSAALSALDSVKAFRGLRVEDLDRVSATERTQGLETSASERNQILAALGSDAHVVGARALVGLWAATGFALPSERERIRGFVVSIVRGLLARGDVAQVAEGVRRIIPSASSSVEDRGRLEEFLGFLREVDVFSSLVRLLDVQEGASESARMLLLQLPSSDAELFLDAAEGASRTVAVQLGALLAEKLPDPPTLATWLLVRGDAAAALVFDLGDRLSPEHFDMALRTALIHNSPAVRARALRVLPQTAVAAFRSLLLNLLDDANDEVSDRALRALVRTRDLEVVPALVARLESASTTPEGVHNAIRALGTLAGESAVDGLAGVLRSDRSREHKRAAVFALAASRSPRALALLSAESKRFFGDRSVKEACRDALKRAEDKVLQSGDDAEKT